MKSSRIILALILCGFLFACAEEEITPTPKKVNAIPVQNETVKAGGDTANGIVGNSKS